MSWTAQAPSNIALIKYMGKKSEAQNAPDNPSLSYTLNHLRTTVSLAPSDDEADTWEPLRLPDALTSDLRLTTQSIDRFLAHLNRLKMHLGYAGAFLVRSANNFPQGVGIASSASSFAALTKCALEACSHLTRKPVLSVEEQAHLSRQGSGSSCRSFFGPWCIWEEDRVFEVSTSYPSLIHQVVIFDARAKAVSSSEAHRRVRTSPHYLARPDRAKARLSQLMHAFSVEDWGAIYQVCFDEFIDMHQLFETASPSFSYMTPACLSVLEDIRAFWKQTKDGPIVTMDAGSTIHLLYRPDQEKMSILFKETVLRYHDVI